MILIHAEDPDNALEQGIQLLRDSGKFEASRAGEVLVAPRPVTTVWSSTRSLAILHPVRDANPFFHLNEAIWMLKGENDARLLDTFVSDFSKRFAEEDGTLHGAYGHRWRKHFYFDQLEWIISKLKEDPRSRQCVLQMWDASFFRTNGDYLGQGDLTGNWKDRPCNTHVYFRIQNGELDMTVSCRSNDMVWGAYGANVVHFGVLHEYMAAKIGVKLGTYYQISNNFHAYTDILGPMILKTEMYPKAWVRQNLRTMPMFNSPGDIDKDLEAWDWQSSCDYGNNLFMFTASANHALAQYRAGQKIDPLFGDSWWDWTDAVNGWINRRRK